jgi:hypothetical protein
MIMGDDINDLVQELLQDDNPSSLEGEPSWLTHLPLIEALSEKSYFSKTSFGLSLLVLEITPLSVLVATTSAQTLEELRERRISIHEALRRGDGLWWMELYTREIVKSSRSLR